MSFIKFASEYELFSWAAEDFVARALAAFEHKDYFDVALSGGSTAQNYFAILSKRLQGQIFLNRLRFFVSDERVVDFSSKDSNAGNAWLKLLKPLGLAKSQLFALHDQSYPPAQGALEYEKLLKELLHKEVPVFDIIYLGVGLDGHTASIFPYSTMVKNIDADPRLVAAPEEEVAGYKRLSFMPRLINAAAHICIMAPGASKAQIINDIMTGPLDPIKLPAQLIMRTHNKNLSVLLSTS